MLVTTRCKRAFINDALGINTHGKPIRQVKSAKTLGLRIEDILSWSKQVLGLLKRVLNYVDLDTLVNIYKVFTQRHLEYCSVV